MSFYCNASNAVVKNKRKILLPAEIRKVSYVGIRNPERGERGDIQTEISEGWEIVKEFAVAEDLAEEFAKTHIPVISNEIKTVKYTKPPLKREPFKKNRDEEEDKPENID